MKSKLVFLMIVLTIAAIITGCSDKKDQVESSCFQTEEDSQDTGVQEDEYYTLLIKSDNYTVHYRPYGTGTGLDNYKVEIFDINGNLIDTVYTWHEPKFVETMYNEDIVIGLWEQAGTGISTRYALFYNVSSGEKSEQLPYYLDVKDGKVALGDMDGVEVRDIFDSQKYYKKFSEFSEEICKSRIDAVNAAFSAENNKLTVTYYYSSTETKTEVFELN